MQTVRNFIRTYPGHSIYSLHLVSQEIGIVTEFQKEKSNIISVEKDKLLWYCSALNKDAAFRKFNARAKRAYKQLNPDQ